MKQLIGLVFFFGVLSLVLPKFMQNGDSFQTVSSGAGTKVKSQPAKSVAVVTTGSREVRLEPDSRGHYVAEFKMNGRAVTALVDTGASSVAINKSTARKLGLNVSPNDFIYEANTANGIVKMAITTIREIQIGRVTVRDVEAAVLEDKALDGTLLGMSFLKRLDGFAVKDGDLILKQ